MVQLKVTVAWRLLVAFLVFAATEIPLMADEEKAPTVAAAQTDDEFLIRLKALVEYRTNLIDKVTEATEPAFTKAVEGSSDLETEKLLKQQIKSFRIKGIMPLHADLIHLAATDQMYKSAVSVSVYELLREARQLASSRKWEGSYAFCNDAIDSMASQPQHFDPCLYTLLEPGLKVDLEGAPSAESKNNVTLEVVERRGGIVVVQLNGTFDGDEKTDRKLTLQIPTPTTMERFNRSLPPLNGSYLREDPSKENAVITVSRGSYEDDYRKMQMSHDQGFAVYESVVSLTLVSNTPAGNVRTSEEQLEEMTRRAIARSNGDLFADFPAPAPLFSRKNNSEVKCTAIIVLGDLIQHCPTFARIDAEYRKVLGPGF